MKLIIFLAVCIVASNANTQPPFNELKEMWQGVLMEYIDDCLEESGADRALAERIIPFGEYAEDKKLKCFSRCVCSGLHMVGEDAAAHNYDFLDKLHIYDAKLRKKLINVCVKKFQKGNDCSRSFYTSKCIYYTVKKALTEENDDVENL